jgi:outer membrane protein assembly factor BamD
MRRILILIFSFLLIASCLGRDKKEETKLPPLSNEVAIEVYKEGLEHLKTGDYFYASKKFGEAETLLPQTEWAEKSALMASYCLYAVNFYEETVLNLERFVKMYPASRHLSYAHYLIAISYYEQILDEKRDIEPLLLSKKQIEFFLDTFPKTDYAIDLKFKLDLIINQLAAKELSIARFYIKNQKWIPAINRLKIIVDDYEETIFVEEALHRLVEIYYRIGLENEAKAAAALLGYNYNSSEWYARSYKVLNKNYKSPKITKGNEEGGLIRRTIKKLLFIND